MAADTHCEPEEGDDRGDWAPVDRTWPACGEDPRPIERYVAEAAARLAAHWQNVSAEAENEAEMEAEGD